MAEHPNVGLLRKVYEAFAKGDMATLTEMFAENVVWHIPGSNRWSGEHRGRDAVFAMFAGIAELSGGTYRVELHAALANDEHAVALSRATAGRQGKQIDLRNVNVYHLENGKIMEAWVFAEDQRLIEEFWS